MYSQWQKLLRNYFTSDVVTPTLWWPPSSSFTLITTGRTKLQHTAQERSWRWTIEVRNMLSYWMLWIRLIIKYCVSCWITDMRSVLVSTPLKEFWSLDLLDGVRHFCSSYSLFSNVQERNKKNTYLCSMVYLLAYLTVRPSACCNKTTAGQV